jgi:hypothetical protein
VRDVFPRATNSPSGLKMEEKKGGWPAVENGA